MKKSKYSSVTSNIIREFDERLPFNCFKTKIDWTLVLKWMNDNVHNGDIDE